MELWMDLLFGNSIGLMSISVIAITVLLMAFYAVYFIKKVNESEPKH